MTAIPASELTNALPMPRPGILDIQPYKGGESEIEGRKDVHKLSSNEGALGPSLKAVEAFHGSAAALHRYPEGGAIRLREAIAKRHGLDPAMLVCGAGSDELIGLLVASYCGEGDEIIQTRHGFLMYANYARIHGAVPVYAPEADLTADVDALLAAVTPRTRIVFVANPNNPTGTWLPASALRRLRAALRSDIILAIDAAYAEYCVGRPDYEDGAALVRETPNTVMFRTFSKIHGLAALRLGWMYAPKDIIDVFNRTRSPFNLTVPTMEAGIAAILDEAHEERVREHTGFWLSWMKQQLRGLGFDMTESVANFVLLRFPDPSWADAADQHLRRNGVIARRVSGYGLPECLRITIGLEVENRAVVAALESFARERGLARS